MQDHLIPGVNVPDLSSIHTDACNDYSPSRLSDARITLGSPTKKIKLPSDYGDDDEPAAIVNVARNIKPSLPSSSAHPVVDLQGPSGAATAAGGQQQQQDSSDAVPAGAHPGDQEVEQRVAGQEQDQDGQSEVASSRPKRVVIKCDGMQPALLVISLPVGGANSAVAESDAHSETGFVPDPDATESGSD